MSRLRKDEVMIRAVYFDIGETILDRTREYAAWAGWLGVPTHTFSAVFGAMIADGHPVREVIARFRTEPDFGTQHAQLVAAGRLPYLGEEDLYDDVRPVLARLRAMGLRVGIVGNQPAEISRQLRALELPADMIASSQEWGVAKPSSGFFERVVADAGAAPAEIVYVGDQLANDVLPAVDAGLAAIRVLTGPWGHLVRDDRAEARCLAVVDRLARIPELLDGGEEGPDQRRRGG
jgi:HAD superfamily hydrolase (TIGR01662 family)